MFGRAVVTVTSGDALSERGLEKVMDTYMGKSVTSRHQRHHGQKPGAAFLPGGGKAAIRIVF